VAGDIEDGLADAIANEVVRCLRVPGGLRKADAAALRKSAREAARGVVAEMVTPLLVKLASIAERIEWLEEQSGGGSRGRRADYGR